MIDLTGLYGYVTFTKFMTETVSLVLGAIRK